MKEVLSTNGVMMQNGLIIGSNVHLECDITNNKIRYSYENECGANWGSTNYSPATTPIYDRHEKITGLMFNKPEENNEFYVCWNN
jgi:hypothetical protein